MLRAEVRLIGKEGLTGAERDAQLAAFRELILDTNRQNFFIKVNGGKEIHEGLCTDFCLQSRI